MTGQLLPRPSQPAFLKVRRDPSRLLTPLRRRLRHAYVRATELGLLGLVPLKTHVVICGFPRSGTTLLQAMLEVSAANARSYGRERSALAVAKYTWPGRNPIVISKLPDDIFRVDQIRDYYRHLRTDVRFIVSVRDPRAVLTSIFVDKPGYCVPPVKWRAVFEHVRYQRQFDDVIVTEYRDLVEQPDRVQQRLATFTGCQTRLRFEEFHAAVPGHFDTRPLNGVRPLDRGSLDKWRSPEHRTRIQYLLRELPELPQRLIELGYETDTRWVEEYA
jgi:hypothetical protein